ncbi:cysteine-rich and transmembrane domain-containing protein WIH1-like [Abrus precatorius]|uniref:Cysteine-rich and transmembrane domain-containing protein WIH1-like n=1 Tax=Abrus precatorius TaxID=3816 RepID=A0A8B8LL01_ABRPR|nr:cysteine-rich and transmembrane domain-containing protein WIH1-like [Abrus precatorius]
MEYYNQNPPMGVAPPPPPPLPPLGYPQPGYQGAPPPQPQVVVNQAPPMYAQEQGSGATTGLFAGCLAALGCCCCLEACDEICCWH